MEDKRHGFSLVELMIVISMIAIIAGLTLINMRSLQKLRTKQELALLQSACGFLQARAMASNQVQELILDEKANSYSYGGYYHQLPASVRMGILAQVKGPPSSPTAYLTSAVTFADKKIVFHPDGIIGAGAVYLMNADGTDLYALTSGISHASFLRMYRYDGQWQMIDG